MKVTVPITTTREVEREIELPYFAKDKYDTKFIRINEDKSILSVSIVTSHKGGIIYANMEMEKNGTEKAISKIMLETPSTEDEFESAICSVIDYMDTQVKAFE